MDHASGFFMVPRDIRNLEPIMRDGTLAQIYLALGSRARHVDGWASGSHGEIWLSRGQCIAGIRELATLLGVAPTTVNRGLSRLEKIGLIERKAEHRGTVLTLRMYGEFGQSDVSERNTDEYSSEYSSGTPTSTAPSTAAEPKDTEKGKGKREGGRKTPLPGDWAPNNEHRALASQISISVTDQADRFRDYAVANAKTYADWNAAFRNWLKKAAEFSPNSKPRRPAEIDRSEYPNFSDPAVRRQMGFVE